MLVDEIARAGDGVEPTPYSAKLGAVLWVCRQAEVAGIESYALYVFSTLTLVFSTLAYVEICAFLFLCFAASPYGHIIILFFFSFFSIPPYKGDCLDGGQFPRGAYVYHVGLGSSGDSQVRT
jgi:hypothetical protein